jgi:calcineurin-like phosphoesterase family protein
MVERWVNVVASDDWVIHCGDVAMGRWEDAKKVVQALSGRKVLLRGNHDGAKFVKVYRDLGWHVFQSLSLGNTLFQHHPIEKDEEFDHELVVHGHSHGSLTKDRHADVGVDDERWNKYEPLDARFVLGVEQTHVVLVTLNTMFG